MTASLLSGALLLLVLALDAPFLASGATLSAVVAVKKTDLLYFGTTASDNDWAAELPDEKGDEPREARPLVYTTAALSDPFGCTPRDALALALSSSSSGDSGASSESGVSSGSLDSALAEALPADGSFVLMVDRGVCSFAEKALYAQQVGAAGLVVVDTLAQAYNRSQAKDATDWDREMEYSCANGRATVPVDDTLAVKALTAVDEPDWAEAVNAATPCNTSADCASAMCMPSGEIRQVCCVWDVVDAMGFKSSDEVPSGHDIKIPVVRLGIVDGNALKELLDARQRSNNKAKDTQVLVTLYERAAPMMDPSQAITWLLAIVTVMVGGYKGAVVERERALRQQSVVTAAAAAAAAPTTNDSTSAPTLLDASNQAHPLAVTNTNANANANANANGITFEEEDEDVETLELTARHAFAFVVFASAFLLVLFYWNVVIVVVVFFCLSSVSSTFVVLWQPLLGRVGCLERMRPFASSPPANSGWRYELHPETWTIADLVAFTWSLGVVLLWFLCRHRSLAWILQDLFGVCLCILFLRTIRLPNLKIATLLLVLVFGYDIFMVFISRYIFQESVMIKAATGGAQARSSSPDGYCDRYPLAQTCLREAMPILLRIPKIIDWRGGQSMLGLGDIVLPGLLIVFCARYDYTTRGQLLGRVTPPHLARLKSRPSMYPPATSTQPVDSTAMADMDADGHRMTTLELPERCKSSMTCRRGLFSFMIWGYAIGLLLANVGVMLMKQGQPALMYIVPCTLGTLLLVSWRRGILSKLWHGPDEFRSPSQRQARASRAQSMDQEGPAQDEHLVVVADATPVSTYSRSDDTPRSTNTSTSQSRPSVAQRLSQA